MRESKAKLLDLLRQNVLLSEAVVNTANNDAASWPIHLCSVLRHMPVTHTCACVCDGVCVRVCVCICASVPVPERRILPPQLLHFRRHALHLRCIRADHLLHLLHLHLKLSDHVDVQIVNARLQTVHFPRHHVLQRRNYE